MSILLLRGTSPSAFQTTRELEIPACESALWIALRRWRLPVPPRCTKGEACDLLTAAVGRAS